MNILLDIYLEKNLGDDLFLIRVLERYPEVTFHVFCQKDYQSIAKIYPNLKLIKLNKYLNFFLVKSGLKKEWINNYIKRKKISAYLCIGGSIFMQSENWQAIYEDRLAIWQFLQRHEIPLYILGANFGPYTDSVFLESYRQAFKLAKDICFRDQYSYQLFKDLAQVRRADDIVFGLALPSVDKIPQSLGISVIDLSSRPQWQTYQELYLTQLTQLINQALLDGYQVRLFSFCESEGDEYAINELLTRVGSHPAVIPVYYRDNLQDFLKQFQAMEYILATRFHSFILALVNQQATLALNYSSKTQHIIDENQLGVNSYSIDQMNEIAWTSWQDYFKKIGSVETFIQSSDQHFSNLDALMAKGG